MKLTRIVIGDEAREYIRIWMPGTKEEVVERIEGRFKIYREKPKKPSTLTSIPI